MRGEPVLQMSSRPELLFRIRDPVSLADARTDLVGELVDWDAKFLEATQALSKVALCMLVFSSYILCRS